MGRRYFSIKCHVNFPNILLYNLFSIFHVQNLVTHNVRSTTGKVNVQLVCKDVADSLKSIVHENYESEEFVKDATTLHEDGVRIYSQPESGKWWIDIEVRLKSSWQQCLFICPSYYNFS